MIKTLYEKNMKFIKKLNYQLYEKIINVKLKTVKKIITKNNYKNIVKTNNGNEFIIHSQYNPKYEAKFIAKDVFENSKYDIVFLFGLGFGYELKEMIKLNSNIRYFIVEPDEEIFKLLIQTYDIKFLFDNMNIHFILGKNPEDIGDFYEKVIGFEKSINIKFVILPSYQIIYEDLINDTFSIIKEKINIFRVNINTRIMSRRQWVQNYIGNLKYLDSMCPVVKLKTSFAGKPAILVSAGPSLDYNIETLRKLQGKVLIAAAGSAISVLEKKGIKFDIACMIDGWENEFKLIKDIKLNKDVSLFYSSMLYYKISDELTGPKFLLNINNFDSKIYDEFKEESFSKFSGPSVANSLAYNLSELGCNPIIFLGQDFCYNSGKNYANGATYERHMSKEFNTENYIKLTNKKDEYVYTTRVFLAMKSSMEFCIKIHPNIKYLNGTENGLSIEGAVDIDFNKYADEKLMDSEYTFNLKHISNKFINDSKNSKKINYIIKKFEDENLNLIKLCKESISFIESDANDKEKCNLIEKIENKINKIALFKDILKPDLINLDYIYKNKTYLEKTKQKFSYILDECLIMDNAFTYILKGGNAG
jgi:hypothetical protein